MRSEMPFLYLDFKQKIPDLEPGSFQNMRADFFLKTKLV